MTLLVLLVIKQKMLCCCSCRRAYMVSVVGAHSCPTPLPCVYRFHYCSCCILIV
jgi:hypothetical protein